jgi:hypothetical protein
MPVSRFHLAVATSLLAALLSAPAAGQVFDSEARAAVIDRIGELLVENYVFPETAEQCSQHLHELWEEGELDFSDTNVFAEAVTRELQSVSKDKHMRVRPGGGPPPEPTAEEREEYSRRQWAVGRERNFGFENVLRLPDNVGVLDLRSFQSVEYGRETAMAAMTYLSNSDALIVDLRQNGGGDPEMVQLLCSYLFDEPTHLNSLYWRATDETQEFWSLDEKALPGPRMPDLPVFVLTSAYTFSGAEEFAYNLKNLERATLVGETTGGGAHPGDTFPVNDRFGIFIPMGRAISPITQTNWEGTGVSPHVEVKAGDAMTKAVEMARKAARKHREKSDQA